jgi:hypothetical protein
MKMFAKLNPLFVEEKRVSLPRRKVPEEFKNCPRKFSKLIVCVTNYIRDKYNVEVKPMKPIDIREYIDCSLARLSCIVLVE